MSLLVAGIGRLYTNDQTIGAGRCGILDDAWIAVDGAVIAAVGTGEPPPCDERLAVDGACVLPGFVDSHSHLVFGGDRADEFAARMAGAPYRAGGIDDTVVATRRASDEALYGRAAQLRREAERSGTTTIEVKSGYGLTPRDERRLLGVAGRITGETTFLGAHLVPAGFDGGADDFVDLVCHQMLDVCASEAKWIDAFCETGAFDADQCREVLTAGRARGLGLRLHANQLGPGPGVQLAVELGCASADHCTYLTDADVAALAASDTVATFLPATDFSTRQPYPDARRALDAGVTVALASNCNPGSSFTTSIPFCLALAVRDMGMTIDEAVWAATAGGAAALRRDDIGRPAPGMAADVVVLDAPSPIHFVYRPGVPLVRAVIRDGALVHGR